MALLGHCTKDNRQLTYISDFILLTICFFSVSNIKNCKQIYFVDESGNNLLIKANANVFLRKHFF